REALVSQLMEHFRQEPFHYTLQPESLGEGDTVDELMFETREGFCEHYASALGFMLRSAGIPARIVTGYLGGESGVDNEYLIVRQYDAHAWVQAWLPGRGWVRLDPTAMIAPERVENGLRDAMEEQGDFLEDNPFSMSRYRDLGWVNWMRLRLDAANYYWQRWVVGYEGQTQLSLLGRLPGDIDRRMLGIITATLVAVLIMTGVGISVLRSRRRHFRDPWYRLYDQWCRWHSRHRTGAGRSDPLSEQVAEAVRASPSRAREIRALGGLLEESFYGGDAMEARDLARARRLMNALRKRKHHG
ncbi:MAG: transglutaminase-like domain-containing protein, partial [Pseudomonadota bacterium]